MARRQARKSSPRPPEPPRRKPSNAAWRYWIMLAVIGLLVLVMVVTSLPVQ